MAEVDVESVSRIMSLLNKGRSEDGIWDILKSEAEEYATKRSLGFYEQFSNRGGFDPQAVERKLKIKIGGKWIKLFPDAFFDEEEDCMFGRYPFNKLSKENSNIDEVLNSLYLESKNSQMEKKTKEFNAAKRLLNEIKELED